MALKIGLFFLAYYCALFYLPTTSAVQNERIVIGSLVSIEDFPYQLSLELNGTHICGGVIISEAYAITTVKCAGQLPITLRVGSSYIGNNGTVISVNNVYIHPSYNESTSDFDLAILELAEKLTFGPTVQPVILPPLNKELVPNTYCNITGWGTTDSNNPDGVSEQLRFSYVPIISENDCKNSYGAISITDSMFCAGHMQGGRGPCGRDVGGPLVHNMELLGVFSWSYGCVRVGYYGVFSNISFLRNFITEITGL